MVAKTLSNGQGMSYLALDRRECTLIVWSRFRTMWLLSTARAELKFFHSPEDVPGGYAILSHVWLPSSQEDTFQSVQRLSKPSWARRFMASISSTFQWNPRTRVSPKIRNFLIIAERYGYAWAWADTCCIDKTSSAELTEAINSMFRYYRLSSICFAYLMDVPISCDGLEQRSHFLNSRWHRRGWTLQELLAPETVLFMSNNWKPLGTKFRLAEMVSRSTGIPAEILRLEKDITEVSIAARMSWAATRSTTRVEDEAYCLFGLFGINMPTLYGEGQNAFYRLQEEIIRSTLDTSLFAWGSQHVVKGVEDIVPTADETNWHCLLASSPAAFISCRDVVFKSHNLRLADNQVRMTLSA